MYLLSLSAGGWILFFQSLFFHFIRHGWYSVPAFAMFNALGIYTLITALFYRIFILEERDQKIFDKHISAWEQNPNKKRDLFITSFIAAVPYVAMIGVKIFIRHSMASKTRLEMLAQRNVATIKDYPSLINQQKIFLRQFIW